MIMRFRAVVVTVFLAISSIRGLPDGAPIDACSTLTPQHDANVPRTCFQDCDALNLFLGEAQEPAETYRCGETYNVRLNRIGTTPFRGFFVQARAVTPVFDPTAPHLGEFISSNIAQTRNCSGIRGAGITHTERGDKDSVSFNWIAPPAGQPRRITFWYTLVVNFTEFYVHLNTTLFPDQESCSAVVLPTIAIFSLPDVLLTTQEGEDVQVCVTKEGETEQSSVVTIFTQEIAGQARSGEDFQSLERTIVFGPQDSLQCVSIFIIPDNINEDQEVFSVAISVNDETAVIRVPTVIIAIIDDSNNCSDGEVDCRVEPLCIPQEYVCDGINDCLNPVDETMCEPVGEPCEVDGEFRLSGGETQVEGLVEVCYEGLYSSICPRGLSVFNASFVCQELGFNGGGVWVNALREFRTIGSGPVLQDCMFNDMHLVECTHSSFGDCDHLQDVGIRCLVRPGCDHGSIRLLGGSSGVEGAVQICINGVWGSIVFSGGWTFSEARVVCRMLGHNEYGALPIPFFSYENSSMDFIFADFVNCNGFENSLLDCNIDYEIGEVSDTGYHVGVRCDDLPATGCDNGEVRLVARESDSEGRVEMCLNSTWSIICSNGWNSASAMAVCRQLAHSEDGSGFPNQLLLVDRGQQVQVPFLQCSGDGELNCISQPVCNTGSEAGVRCAVSPRLLLRPASENGVYRIEVGRRRPEVICFLEPNHYYPQPTNVTVYRLVNDEMSLIETTIGSEISVIRDGARPEDAGSYICRAENAVGFASATTEINVIVPRGSRSRVYVRFSLPRLEDRLRILFEVDEEVDVPLAIEEFLIFQALDEATNPGQQVVDCSNASRMLSDFERKRDRYECILDNYPPLVDNPTALAEVVVLFLREQFVSFSAFNISVAGFCDSEPSDYDVRWPETEANSVAFIPCGDGRVATRVCSSDNGAEWLEPDTSLCPAVVLEVLFSLPNETLIVDEENREGFRVCVSKTGETERTFAVRIFTNELEGQAKSDEDYVDFDTMLQFTPSDNFQCTLLNIIIDGFVEGPEELEVVISVGSQNALANPSRLTVVINESNPVCNIGEFHCQQEDFCLPPEYVCDGIDDCLAPVDERNRMCEPVGEPCEVDGEFRLRGGETEAEGLVELCHEGRYSSICDNEISPTTAASVCRELGFNGGGVWVNALREFGIIGSGPILDNCIANATHLVECSSSFSSFGCDHPEDVGVRCQATPDCEGGSIRLVGGGIEDSNAIEGAVQICLNGVWGSITSSVWAFSEARIVCRMLGRDEYGALPIPSFSYENSGTDSVFYDFINCDGSEESLFDCFISFRNERSIEDSFVGVRCDDMPEVGCSEGNVRLDSRDSDSTGRVEVCLDNTWRSICSSSWDNNDALVVCRQLDHTGGAVFTNTVQQQRLPPATLFLQCRGEESNLLQCILEPQRKKRQQQSCPTGQEAFVRCIASPPRIFLSPATENGMYEFELGREGRVSCGLEQNRFYPTGPNITIFRVIDNEMVPVGSSLSSQRSIIGGRVSVDDAGIYVCKVEIEGAGSAMITANISIKVPSGPRSRVYIRLSLPQFEGRLGRALESNDIQDALNAIEEFLILEPLDPIRTPGQQLVECTNTSRMLSDIKRKRDRYECILDNFPPLIDNPTSVANIVVQFMEEVFVAISVIKVSVAGFCDSEPSDYDVRWPETEADNVASIPCGDDGRVATRVCSSDNGAEWLEPDTSQCDFCCNSETDNLCIERDRVCDGIAHCNFLEDESRCDPVLTNCNDGDVRLSLGVSSNDGIVEYCNAGAWGSLCENTFSFDNAEVVCRQLGLPSGAVLLSNIQSLIRTHRISVSCTGSEASLGECDRTPSGNSSCVDLDIFTRAAVRCQEPVDCEDGELRLVGGMNKREGNLQICFNGVWGSVCLNNRDSFLTEAAVACRQLGYNPSGALSLPRGSIREDPSTIPLLRSVYCNGDENQLVDCLNNGKGEKDDEERDDEDCQSVPIRCDEFAVQNCVNGSVRLRDRENRQEGTVEYCLDGQWGTLCNDEQSQLPFSDSEVQVLCRQLGFAPEGFSRSRRLEQQEVVHTVSFQCGGQESSLLECGPSPFFSEACSGDENNVLTVVCFGLPNLYLDPPPTENNTYVVEVGHPLEVTCATDNTSPSSEIFSYRVGSVSDPEGMCFEFGDFRQRPVDHRRGIPLSAAGDYKCIACNSVGTSFVIFTVEIQVPEVEGSSAFLRLSVPNVERLAVILDLSEEELEGVLLEELQALIASTEVITEEDGIQTIECNNAIGTPEDSDARRDRYECNITTYSPTSRAGQLADGVAIEIQRENVQLFAALTTSETGFCSFDVDETMWGTYMWPETSGESTSSLTCQLDDSIIVTRLCQPGGTWDMPQYGNCIMLGNFEVTEDNIEENTAVVAMAVQQQQLEQTDDSAEFVRDFIVNVSRLALTNASLVNEELVDDVIGVLDGLQEWPEDAVRADDNGAEIVESFEVIAITLAQQENFTGLTVSNENIAVNIQNVARADITTGRSLAVSDIDGNLNATLGDDSTLEPDQLASGFLPLSLFERLDSDEENIPIVFAILRTGNLFSIERNQGDVEGLNTTVGTPVVSLTVGVEREFRDLADPVIVNVRIQIANFSNPRCVSYDFDQQVWVTDGCTTIHNEDSDLITCECDHLTNFASLVDICTRTEESGCGQSDDARLALDVISIIGVILSGLGLIFTIITLLLFKKLRSRDASKFHVQLSLALLGMLVVFVVGIDRTEVFEGCVTVSVLIQYFTLVSVMWMGAEALLMFQKLVIVFVQITTRYIIIVSLICWLAPIIPAVLPAAIDADLVVTDTDTNKFCFIGDVRVFFGAFLGPIFAVLLFNVIIFIVVIIVLIKHTRNKLGKATKDAKAQRKSNIRLAISLFGIMILFGLTWILAAFTISDASLAFQILFAIFNSLQGFFIFVFFCVLSPDVRQLWLEKLTCGRYVQGKSSYSSGGKRGYHTGKLRSGVTQSGGKTASSGLSALPSSHYATDSSIGISEYPSSTVIDESSFVKEKEQTEQTPSTTTEVHFDESSTEKKSKRGASGLGAYESMRVSIDFKDTKH